VGMKLPPAVERQVLHLAGENPARGRADSEDGFDAQVEQLATLFGWATYHTRDSRGSEGGFPDRVFSRGRVLFVAELKVEPNKPEPAQLEWLDRFRAAGIPAYLWYPKDWDLIVEVLTNGCDRSM